MMRHNGYTSATADVCRTVDWTPAASLPALPPLAEVSPGEAVVYVLGAVSLLILAAMIWTHYDAKGARK